MKTSKMFVVMLFCILSSFFGEAQASPKKVNLTTLQTYRFDDLYADLIGIQGQVPASAMISFEKNLGVMWNKKLNRKRGVTQPAEDAADGVLVYYSKNQTKMTLQQYVEWINRDIERVKKSVDWVGFCGVRLKGERCKLLKAVAQKTLGIDLVAYGMTELFPSANGTLNVHLMEVLLRNAGRQYLETIPAMHDKYASLGFWQFTQFAVYNANGEVRGASEVNLYIGKQYQIPGSVLKLRNEHHHRAAYMFALSNLKDLVKRMSNKEINNLFRGHEKHRDELVQFIAIAHHLPGPSFMGARRWAANNMKTELQISLGNSLRMYAKKTQANLLALYKATKQKRT